MGPGRLRRSQTKTRRKRSRTRRVDNRLDRHGRCDGVPLRIQTPVTPDPAKHTDESRRLDRAHCRRCCRRRHHRRCTYQVSPTRTPADRRSSARSESSASNGIRVLKTTQLRTRIAPHPRHARTTPVGPHERFRLSQSAFIRRRLLAPSRWPQGIIMPTTI